MTTAHRTTWKVIYWNIVIAVMLVALGAGLYVRRLHRFDKLIVETGRVYNIDPRLVSCVIWAESRFDPTRIGTVDEVGLMQVTEIVARDWAAQAEHEPFNMRDFFNPELNIRVGTWYLAGALENWSHLDDPLPYALAEYNAGRSNARRWAKQGGEKSRDFWEVISYPTTKRYVRDILQRYRGGV